MVLAIISTITFIAMLVINYLANSIPIGGNTTGDISGEYSTLFTPSGFTFSIWGIIYLLLIVFVVMLFRAEETITTNKDTVLILFNITNLLNIAWLFSWHNDQILLSTIVMFLLLAALLTTVTLISKEDTFAFATFSIYAGWISVASVANVAILFAKQNVPFFMNHQMMWFVIILAVTLVIGGYMLIKEKNVYYASVFVWAYLGIAAKFI
jgi:tryptophan-rich sensory protein